MPVEDSKTGEEVMLLQKSTEICPIASCLIEDFDLLDRCLVSYNSDSQIFVYSVVSEIYAIYNMTLPLYTNYEGF